MNIAKECSWSLRRLLKYKKYVMRFIHYALANGEGTSIWHDPWCGPLPLLQFEFVVQNLPIPLDVKVSCLITDGEWNTSGYQYARV